MARNDGLLVEQVRQFGSERFGEAWWAARSASLAAAERQDEVRVAFVGQFNAGKSTLINALLGVDVLPIGALPTSAAVVEVRSGERWSASRRVDGVEEILDEEAFRAYATGTRGEGARVDLAVRLPSPRLAGSVTICDTPGVNAMDAQHAAITYGYLPSCDAVVLVIDAQRGLLDTDQRFLKDHILAHTRERLVVVATHLDLVPSSQRSEVVAATRNTLARLELPTVPVVGVAPGDVEPVWQAIEARILAFRGAIRDERVARTQARIARELVSDLRRFADRLGVDDAAHKAELTRIGDARVEVRKAREQLRARLVTAESALLTELDAKVHALVESLASQAPAYVEAARKEGGGSRVSAKVQADLARASEALLREWLAPRLSAELGALQEELSAKTPDLPALKDPGNGLPEFGGILIDAAVEIAVIALLNVVLPGEWLVAGLARLLGKNVLGDLLEPFKQTIKDTVAELLGGVVRSKVEAELASAIRKIEPELRRSLGDQASATLQRGLETALSALERRIDELERDEQEARRVRSEGEAAVTRTRAEIAKEIQSLLAAGAPV
jgi:GTP-binding protein EngB required for normal cell division